LDTFSTNPAPVEFPSPKTLGDIQDEFESVQPLPDPDHLDDDQRTLGSVSSHDSGLEDTGSANSTPPEFVSVTTFVDFVQVLTGVHFNVFRPVPGRKIKIHSSYFRKPFSAKHFHSFDCRGHCFFLGTIDEYTIHLVAKDNTTGCTCATDHYSVTASVAQLIYQCFLHALSTIPSHTLEGYNLVINSSGTNFFEHSVHELELVYLGTEFKTAFANKWRLLRSEASTEEDQIFFANHIPHFVISNYGQNIPLQQYDVTLSSVLNVFQMQFVEDLSLSIAANCRYNGPGFYSLALSKQSILQLYKFHKQDVKIFKKLFSDLLCNFQAETLPSKLQNYFIRKGYFRDGNPIKFTCTHFHGYSTVANVLRRNIKSEPYVSYPATAVLQLSRPQTLAQKHKMASKKAAFTDQKERIKVALTKQTEVGSDYRFEITFTAQRMPMVSTVALENFLYNIFEDYVHIIKEMASELLEFHKPCVFPGFLTRFTSILHDCICHGVENHLVVWNTSIRKKEFYAVLEALLLHSINGNQRNVSHSIFRKLDVLTYINYMQFPFFNPNMVDCESHVIRYQIEHWSRESILLQDQNAGITTMDSSKIREHYFYLLLQQEETKFVDLQTLLQKAELELQFWLLHDLYLLVQHYISKKDSCNNLPSPSIKQIAECTLDNFLEIFRKLCSEGYIPATTTTNPGTAVNSWFSVNDNFELTTLGCFSKLKSLKFVTLFSQYLQTLQHDDFRHSSYEPSMVCTRFKNFLLQWRYLPFLQTKGWTGTFVCTHTLTPNHFSDLDVIRPISKKCRPNPGYEISVLKTLLKDLATFKKRRILDHFSTIRESYVTNWAKLACTSAPHILTSNSSQEYYTLFLWAMVEAVFQIKASGNSTLRPKRSFVDVFTAQLVNFHVHILKNEPKTKVIEKTFSNRNVSRQRLLQVFPDLNDTNWKEQLGQFWSVLCEASVPPKDLYHFHFKVPYEDISVFFI
jgi:hypothetical protein